MTRATAVDAASDVRGPTAPVSAVVGLLVFFEMLSGFSQVGITPLLPDLADAYGLADAQVNWVHAVQLLAAAVSVPLFGRLGDLLGHRRLLRIALVSIAIGSFLVALAPSAPLLWAGRALQGPLAALLPLEIALVRSRLSVPDARRAIARLVGALTVGGLLGAALMGAAAGALGGVRAALLVPAVLAAVCVALSYAGVPESRPQPGARMDWAGFTLLALGAGTLLLGVSALQEDAPDGRFVASAIVLGAVLLAWWVRVELRAADPLVDVRELVGRRAGPFYLAAAGFGVVYFAAQAPDTTFLAADPEAAGYGFGLSATRISLMLLPAILAAVLGSALTVPIARRLGYRRTLAVAFGLVAASFVAVAVRHTALWEIAATKVVAGLGLGIALSAMPTVVVEAAEQARSGVATALYNNVKSLGGSVAGGVLAALMAARTPASGTPAPGAAEGTPAESAYVLVWLVCGLCALAAAGATLLARRPEDGADAART
ncbi:MFS transporter [Streptomyces sp. MS06]|uniref:MFS transporter n=1 Tax=Streptomyces sp. MS06 TaxID=3385974 RepID=UPI0039A12B29